MTLDPVRILTLLWRAASDIEGAALWNPDDVRAADLMQLARLGHVEKRRPKPHQLSIFEATGTQHEDQWVTYFVLSDEGEDAWDDVLELVRERASFLEGRSEIPS